MVEYNELERLGRFLGQQPIRYQHLLRDLAVRPLARLQQYPDRGILAGRDTYDVDSWHGPSTVIRVRATRRARRRGCNLRVEGALGNITDGELVNSSERVHNTCAHNKGMPPASVAVRSQVAGEASRMLSLTRSASAGADWRLAPGPVVEAFVLADLGLSEAVLVARQMAPERDELEIHDGSDDAEPSVLFSLVTSATLETLARGRLPALTLRVQAESTWLEDFGFEESASSWEWFEPARNETGAGLERHDT